MTPANPPSDNDELARARVNRIPTAEHELEDMPSEIEDEDIVIEGRKPDLGEIEEDTSEL
jgi:hypothetical protein